MDIYHWDFFDHFYKRGLRLDVIAYIILQVTIHKQFIVSFEEKYFEIIDEVFVVLAVMNTSLH